MLSGHPLMSLPGTAGGVHLKVHPSRLSTHKAAGAPMPTANSVTKAQTSPEGKRPPTPR